MLLHSSHTYLLQPLHCARSTSAFLHSTLSQISAIFDIPFLRLILTQSSMLILRVCDAFCSSTVSLNVLRLILALGREISEFVRVTLSSEVVRERELTRLTNSSLTSSALAVLDECSSSVLLVTSTESIDSINRDCL